MNIFSNKLKAMLLLSLCSIFSPIFCHAENTDYDDSFLYNDTTSHSAFNDNDENKSARHLLQEAMTLQYEEKFLEARSKILKALKKDPELLLGYLLLAEYYHNKVGHFRLALRYAKRANEILIKKHGKPPYSYFNTKELHKSILRLISDIRLNLDEYQESLDLINQYEKYNYSDPFFVSSKAWILFKMGKNEEALRVAKEGISEGNQHRGALLNIIGILLSATDQKDESLQIFNEAFNIEKKAGLLGSPAVPLNNAGEVYREIFDESNARKNWEQATLIHDFCSHVLLSVNLAILNIEELDFEKATRALQNFKRCFAQFPLKNSEEHQSLLNLTEGRIALHTGDISTAIKKIESATKEQQFFGKIGTSPNDMKVAALSSYALALSSQNNHLKFHLSKSLTDEIKKLSQQSYNKLKIWWNKRRANQILIDELDDFKDLYIRHTDSILEYHTLGRLTANIPTNILRNKLSELEKSETRKLALIYYKTYLAENLIYHGENKEANQLLTEALQEIRLPYDAALKAELLRLKLNLLEENSSEYTQLIYSLFSLSRSELLNNGLRLPIKINSSNKQLIKLLDKSIFFASNNTFIRCSIDYSLLNNQHKIDFSCTDASIKNITVSSDDLVDAINDLTLAVFKRDL